jgi:hypothetical protein
MQLRPLNKKGESGGNCQDLEPVLVDEDKEPKFNPSKYQTRKGLLHSKVCNPNYAGGHGRRGLGSRTDSLCEGAKRERNENKDTQTTQRVENCTTSSSFPNSPYSGPMKRSQREDEQPPSHD